MVRPMWIRALMAALASTGLAVAQQPAAPPPVRPAGEVITLHEPGKPPQKCELIKSWRTADGAQAHQLKVLDTGETVTLTESGPPTTTAPGAGTPASRAVASKIYHWGRDSKPPTGSPMPPAYPVVSAPKAMAATTPKTVPAPAPRVATAPAPAATAPRVVPATAPKAVATAAPAPKPAAETARPSAPAAKPARPTTEAAGPTVRAPNTTAEATVVPTGHRPAREPKPEPTIAMTAPSEAEAPDWTKDGPTSPNDAGTPVKPGAAPAPLPVMTPTGVRPVPVAARPTPAPGMMQASASMPRPATTSAAAPTTSSRYVLFPGLKKPAAPAPAAQGRGLVASSGYELPKSSNSMPDPFKDPRQYQLPAVQGKTAAAQSAQPVNYPTPEVPAGQRPLGMGSVLAATRDPNQQPQYIPVPIVTVPDINRMPLPPQPNVPQAPQVNANLPRGPYRGVTPNGPVNGFAMPEPDLPTPAFATPGPDYNAFTGGVMPPAAGGPGPLAAGGYGMPGRLPPMPVNGPATMMGPQGYGMVPPQGYPVPPQGYPMMPQGYAMPPQGYAMPAQPVQPPVRPLSPVAYTPGDTSNLTEAHQSQLMVLADSQLPSHREWAAERLVASPGLGVEAVVMALVKAAKDDPAPLVRCACVRHLARVKHLKPVAECLLMLKGDPDERVRQEVEGVLGAK